MLTINFGYVWSIVQWIWLLYRECELSWRQILVTFLFFERSPPRLSGKISLHFLDGKSYFCQNTYDFDQISKSIGTNIL